MVREKVRERKREKEISGEREIPIIVIIFCKVTIEFVLSQRTFCTITNIMYGGKVHYLPGFFFSPTKFSAILPTKCCHSMNRQVTLIQSGYMNNQQVPIEPVYHLTTYSFNFLLRNEFVQLTDGQNSSTIKQATPDSTPNY